MLNYDPHEWRDHLFDIEGSMIREITARVLTCVGWTCGIVAGHKLVVWASDGKLSLGVPETGHALIGAFLGLLLVFRTNSSYDRFWEGRKQWGAIVNECRNLARSASTFIRGDQELVKRLILWTAAFPYATMRRLRGKSDLGSFADSLPPEESRQVQNAQHVPLAVSRRISALIAAAKNRGLVSEYVAMSIDQNVQLLIDYMGACERIHNTPIPYAYMVHLRRAIILYCWTLPFALLDRFGWMTILVVLLVAYTLYGIEEIGVEIEDPFGEDENDLPLEQICQTIEKNLTGVIATLTPPEETTPLPAETAASPVPAMITLEE